MGLSVALPAVLLIIHLFQGNTSKADGPPSWQKVYEEDYIPGPCDEPTDEEKKRWRNKSVAEITAELGDPKSDEKFFLRQYLLVGERYFLREYAERAGDKALTSEIRETSWINDECKLMVWYEDKDSNWHFLARMYFDKDSIIN